MSDVQGRVLAVIEGLKARGDYQGWATELRAKTARFASQPGSVAAERDRVPCSCLRVKDGVRWRGVYETQRGKQVPILEVWGKDARGAPGCLLCEGSGFRPFDAKLDRAGDEADPMVYGADRDGTPRSVPPQRRVEPDEVEGLPWERRHPFWAQLDRALEALRDADETVWRLVVAAYEGRYGWREDGEPDVGFKAGAAIVWAHGFLERRLPVPLRVPRAVQERVELQRRTRALTAEPWRSLGERARENGVSRRSVARAERRLAS